ncbi:hypothetical protein [Roseomonas sp. BN140053]|uniref:hypothetical protein n=1 Tax=Roseomonas sp. BN140053 TaxID=3391898 RepID=UPI0039E8CA99
MAPDPKLQSHQRPDGIVPCALQAASAPPKTTEPSKEPTLPPVPQPDKLRAKLVFGLIATSSTSIVAGLRADGLIADAEKLARYILTGEMPASAREDAH